MSLQCKAVTAKGKPCGSPQVKLESKDDLKARPVERFGVRGIDYRALDKSKSEIYLAMLPLLIPC